MKKVLVFALVFLFFGHFTYAGDNDITSVITKSEIVEHCVRDHNNAFMYTVNADDVSVTLTKEGFEEEASVESVTLNSGDVFAVYCSVASTSSSGSDEVVLRLRAVKYKNGDKNSGVEIGFFPEKLKVNKKDVKE